jgi:hypothetical protein
MPHRYALTAILLALAMAVAHAQTTTPDGVILIDQQRAQTGGIGPGDSSGFPITISEPGSYRLASHLVVPSGKNGIEITAPNVLIDLNGFSITTIYRYTPPYVPPSALTYSGILGWAQGMNVTVRNGTISGFPHPVTPFHASSGIANGWTLENLSLRGVLGPYVFPDGTYSFTVYLGSHGRMKNVIAPHGIVLVSCPAVVTDTVAAYLAAYPSGATGCAFANNAVQQ